MLKYRTLIRRLWRKAPAPSRRIIVKWVLDDEDWARRSAQSNILPAQLPITKREQALDERYERDELDEEIENE
jgi:hypothetical protein